MYSHIGELCSVEPFDLQSKTLLAYVDVVSLVTYVPDHRSHNSPVHYMQGVLLLLKLACLSCYQSAM